ncbi:hypothetical protein GCM10023187_53810 [Nibrella viscosa]|uniref:SGNH/GDSL hydrolase family protein n=1 Tax=Nibrella viscosa TaxID=1084524 RepID=A0ABP8L0U6_9BACT
MKKFIMLSRPAYIATILAGMAICEGMYAKENKFGDPADTWDSTKVKTASKPVFLKRLIEPEFITGNKKVQVREFNLPPSQPTNIPDLGKMQLAGKAFPLVVFGDGLAAGWRDGGLFRAGQQTAFPNLVAYQMGLTNFRSPLFDTEHGNGTGYLIASPNSTGPRWQEVTNNTAIVNSSDIPELMPYVGDEVSNMALPKADWAGMGGTLSPNNNGWVYVEDGRRWTDDMIFLWRLKPKVDKSKYTYWQMLDESLKAKQPSLVLAAFGFDTWIDVNLKSKHVNISWPMASSETPPLSIVVARKAQSNGAAGVVFTLPHFKHLAYFNWYSISQLNQLAKNAKITRTREGLLGYELLRGNMIFLPTKATEALFNMAKQSPNGLEYQLSDVDVADQGEIEGGSPALYNNRIRQEARKNGLLVVDLESLYEKIYEGGFVTDDGYPIDGTPKGNFFSADGLYPSAIGNAVIANETIKVLNQHFNAHIPLINVANFASQVTK